MSTNLVSLITQFLTPDLIAKIAAALGIDKSLAGKAVSAAVPGILAGLTGVASTPGGSRKLFDTVAQNAGVLDSLAGMIGGSKHKTLADNGTDMLSSLLGSSGQSGLAGAIGKYAGLGDGASSSLLGLLAPVVVGALGQQKAAQGLDASGLANLLTSQKSNISAALPSGFSNLLGSTGLLTALSGGAGNAAQAAKSATYSAGASADRSIKQVSGGMPGWLKWVVPLLAAIALVWWFVGRPATTVVENTTEQASTDLAQAIKSLANVTAGDVNIGSAMQSAISGLNDSLKSITDANTAKAALPKLQDATTQLDKVSGVLNQIPADGRSALVALINMVRPSLEELFTKVLAVPGVSEVAKPAIDTIKGKLDGLAKA